jgi:hypothetical protein
VAKTSGKQWRTEFAPVDEPQHRLLACSRRAQCAALAIAERYGSVKRRGKSGVNPALSRSGKAFIAKPEYPVASQHLFALRVKGVMACSARCCALRWSTGFARPP